MTWSEAKNLCKTKGGKLVEIDSEEENTALVDEIKRKGYNIYYIYVLIVIDQQERICGQEDALLDGFE